MSITREQFYAFEDAVEVFHVDFEPIEILFTGDQSCGNFTVKATQGEESEDPKKYENANELLKSASLFLSDAGMTGVLTCATKSGNVFTCEVGK